MTALALTVSNSESSNLESSKLEKVCEVQDRDVLEVTVRWGTTTLGVTHVGVRETLRVGENDGSAVMIPAERLGAKSFALVQNGDVVLPAGASARIEMNGASSDVSDRVTMIKNARVHIALGDMTIEVARVAAGRTTPRSLTQGLRKGILGVALASMLAHVATVGALAFAPPASLDDESASIDRATAAKLQALNEKNYVRHTIVETSTDTGSSSGGKHGSPAQGPSGMMGTPAANAKKASYAIQQTSMTAEEKVATAHAKILANDYGALGALQRVFGAKASIDAGAWGEPNGHDMLTASGNTSGPHIGAAYGKNGLGLTNDGPGDNGFGPWIGVGLTPAFGHEPGKSSWGTCDDGVSCAGKLKGGHVTKAPKVIEVDGGAMTGLPKDVVRRIVRANFPAISACYTLGQKKDPSLAGVVSTRFIIDSTGAVEHASLASSTLGDAAVSSCVVRVFSGMSFPAPESGLKAMVVYPIDLQQN